MDMDHLGGGIGTPAEIDTIRFRVRAREEAGDMNGDGILNSADATVSSSEYQSVMTYATNGKFLDSPAKMTDVSGKPCRYLYVEFGTMKDVFVPKADEAKAINVFLPRYREP